MHVDEGLREIRIEQRAAPLAWSYCSDATRVQTLLRCTESARGTERNSARRSIA
jgi:hypothetical protein